MLLLPKCSWGEGFLKVGTARGCARVRSRDKGGRKCFMAYRCSKDFILLRYAREKSSYVSYISALK